MIKWLDQDFALIRPIIAQYSQTCPDGCGRQIVAFETRVADVPGAGGWRHIECLEEQWKTYTELHWMWETDFHNEQRRLLALGNVVVARVMMQVGARRKIGFTRYVI